MITAKQANIQTTNNIKNFQTKELKRIKEIIEDYIRDGCYSYTANGYLSNNAKELLKSLGYKVTTGTQYNESYYTISWEDV